MIGAVPLFLVAYMRRRLPETKRFEVREHEVEKLSSRIASRARHDAPPRPRASPTAGHILVAVGAFGFAIWPAEFLGPKYLQIGLRH